MQGDDDAPHIVTTAGLLLETSLGSLSIDIIGADCPALSANFLNLCRAGFWNGAVATEVIPEVAVMFSLTADPVYYGLLRKALERNCLLSTADHSTPAGGAKRCVQSFWSLLPRRASDPTAAHSDPAPSSTGVLRISPAAAQLSAASLADDPVEQQERALHQAIQQEVRLCKRRRCVGLSLNHTGNSRDAASVYQPVFTSASSSGAMPPCVVRGAGRVFVDTAAPTLRFGLTVSNRAMEFLDKQYIVIGYVKEGEAVLKRMQRAPWKNRSASVSSAAWQSTAAAAVTAQEDIVAGRPASAWPHPVRMLRIKRALVLPTAGTEKFITTAPAAWSGLAAMGGLESAAGVQQKRQRLGQALNQAGCFEYWASAAAVRVARRQLVGIVKECLALEGYTASTRPSTVAEATALLQKDSSGPVDTASASHPSTPKPYIILQSSNSGPSKSTRKSNDDVDSFELTYNPHFTGAYLSSEDDDDMYDYASRGASSSTHALRLSAKQLEERRKLFKEQHQEKANETLSLMLHVLNGVADIRGDIKPPENVLFVCKLNPVTTGEGLAMCFAQFGRVVSAEVIYDAKTKQSLCYGFVEFETVGACFRAFQKMDQALVDDCRIHVDFSQSVSKLWAQRQREMRRRGRPGER
ncbi:hypothetical protein ABL78_5813 [Leptomonas seymouri]|uniref:Peptidyl-prolyl cis-trans isomerase n=1 Tax=Leptomonas seymouri TaxID=5684 RepID=A0A0N1PB00_LEPSE|nr:hypothetical protein ABL78_5813 [Leptomonas seymouri]|eukprot:KPI85120.1 hypothetical protein ABL78_5813 [Leptomonas seymouri]